MNGFYLTTTGFRRSFTKIYPCKHTQNIAPTWCKSLDGWQPMQLAAMCSRIHLVQNGQVGCYPRHVDLKLTIYSSGLPTSFRYLFPQDFPLHFLIIISSLPQPQIMAPQRPQLGEGGTQWCSTTGGSSNTPPPETQLQCSHHWVHCDTANDATEGMTLDAQLQLVRKTGSSKINSQHTIGSKCSQIEVEGRQLKISYTAVVRRELCEQLIASRNGKPPWSANALLRTICEIGHHDVVGSGIFADEFSDNKPRECTLQALTTLEEGTEACMVEVITECHM